VAAAISEWKAQQHAVDRAPPEPVNRFLPPPGG
jgi:hypothetical protein